jgi:general secretion pathway protein J
MWRNNRTFSPALSQGRGRIAAFTLVELLVALAIFAIVAGFAYRGLQAMLDSREALQRDTRKWRDVALFVGRIERDLSAVLVTPSNPQSFVRRPAPLTSVVETVTHDDGLALTRSGNVLQENALAAPQRIAYRLRDGAVERLTWTSVDFAPREEPAPVRVLGSVAALGFRFLLESGEWRSSWGIANAEQKALPAAVEVTLKLASGETIVRLVDLPKVGS